jgi:SAM-dependent methyltransferase
MWTLGSRANRDELIDGAVESRDELYGSFRDIALINRWFGGTAVARHALRRIAASSVLDVACGLGDISLRLRQEGRKSGREVHFTCLDTNPDVLALARMRATGDPGMAFVRGNGTKLPFEDASFDIAMCNLALHHFANDDAVALLRELRRVSRVTPIVTDLKRSVPAWLAAYSFSRVFTRNRLTRHDAPLSARRAYTPEEALVLAQRAGWGSPRVQSYRLIRMVMADATAI